MKVDKKIAEFPSDDHYWYLTGVGPISISENDFRIEIDFVAMDYPNFKKAPLFNKGWVIRNDNNQIKRAYLNPVGVDYLGFAETGSVWHKQKLIYSPSSYNTNAAQLTVKILEAGKAKLSTIESEIEVPYIYHPFAKSNIKSSCLILSNDNFENTGSKPLSKVIIPSSEVFRFYYCGSGYFIKQLIGNGIPDDKLFVRSDTRLDNKSKEAYINIRKALNYFDLHYAGRLATCPKAQQAAINIGRKLHFNHLKDGSPFLEAELPFLGSSNLSVVGRYIKLKENLDSEELGFLVYSIIGCSARLPYEKLWYDRDNDNRKTNNPSEVKEVKGPFPKNPLNPSEDSLISSTATADNEFTKVPIDFQLEKKFGHVPEIEQVKKDQQQVRTLGNKSNWPADVDSYSTSENQNDGFNIAPGEIQTLEENLSIDFSNLDKVIQVLRHQNIDCHYKSNSSNWAESYHYQSFPIFYTGFMGDNIKKWCQVKTITVQNYKIRQRRIVVVRLISAGRSYYLFELEAQNSERYSRVIIHRPGAPILLDTELNKVLRLMVENKGRWTRCDLSPMKIQKRAFDHLKNDTAEKVVKRISDYLNQVAKF